VFRTVARLTGNDLSVLITGESGTGKELIARALHDYGNRRAGPFVAVNMAAIPRELIEAELFGHERGAFTGAIARKAGRFESANGGTLFLDEVAELPQPLQAKLLRVLEDKEIRPVGATKTHAVDVRIIAATNKDLEEAVRSGSFRQDLYYRLNVVRITMPPLRERKGEIPALVSHFLRRLNERFRRDVRGIATDALAALQAYDFPGNVRELENILESAYALGARHEIAAADLPSLALPGQPAAPAANESLPTLDQAERDLIAASLRRYGKDKGKAAQALGVTVRTFYRRLKKFGLA
jgi:transcriptional regulator with PAS, ATPase and Fis domain